MKKNEKMITEIKEKIAEMELEIKQQRSRIEVLERALDNHKSNLDQAHEDEIFEIFESVVTKWGRKMGIPER